MNVNQTIILKRKLIGDIPLEEMQLIDEARKLDKRTRTSFIRKASVIYAKKILNQKQEESHTNESLSH